MRAGGYRQRADPLCQQGRRAGRRQRRQQPGSVTAPHASAFPPVSRVLISPYLGPDSASPVPRADPTPGFGPGACSAPRRADVRTRGLTFRGAREPCPRGQGSRGLRTAPSILRQPGDAILAILTWISITFLGARVHIPAPSPSARHPPHLPPTLPTAVSRGPAEPHPSSLPSVSRRAPSRHGSGEASTSPPALAAASPSAPCRVPAPCQESRG